MECVFEVIACNMFDVSFGDVFVDCVVFSFSFMGIDYGFFFEEVYCVLKLGGLLWIVEVCF